MTEKNVALNRSLSEYGFRNQKEVVVTEKRTYYKVLNTDDFGDLPEHGSLLLKIGKKIVEGRDEVEDRLKEEYGTDNIRWVDV